jgi:hypothetical protein
MLLLLLPVQQPFPSSSSSIGTLVLLQGLLLPHMLKMLLLSQGWWVV